MKKQNLFERYHTKTKRDYLGRMENNKVSCMTIASKFDSEYWDGDRQYGYGGYSYDGRWVTLAEELIELYKLNSKSKVLDLGCGKAHLLYEIKKIINCEVIGLDISDYAIKNAPEEIQKNLKVHDMNKSEKLPFKDREFDLVLSLMTLHNFELPELKKNIVEIERVSKNAYLTVESYRSSQELFNLQCWALTCQSFFSPREWEYLLRECCYSGEYEFLFFE